MAKRITLKDIAQKAGVTPATVSMALNGNKSIPDTTKNKILKIAKELNYYPNLSARSLVKGKTETIAILAEFYYSPFFQQLLNGVEHRIAETHYSVVHYSTLYHYDRLDDIFRNILYSRVVDGLITFNLIPDKNIVDEFKRLEIPLVVLESTLDGICSVVTDNYAGGYAAGKYLVEQGRKRFACVTVPKERIANQSNVQQSRANGFMKALLERNMKKEDVEYIPTDSFSLTGGACVMKELERRKLDVDAVFCAAGDMVAIGLIHELQNKGIKVPEDIAVIGYDDLDIASYTSPSLTTIRQNGYDMGEKAADLILDHLEHSIDIKAGSTVFTPELIKRDSA